MSKILNELINLKVDNNDHATRCDIANRMSHCIYSRSTSNSAALAVMFIRSRCEALAMIDEYKKRKITNEEKENGR